MIREARPEDAVAVARIHIDAWKQAYRGIVPSSYLENMCYEQLARRWGELLGDETRNTLVYEYSEELAGWLSFGPPRDKDFAGAEIYGIILSPSYWRRGIGTALVLEALRFIGEEISIYLWVLEGNERARRFYDRVGFRRDGMSRVISIGEADCTEVRYVHRSPHIAQAESGPPGV